MARIKDHDLRERDRRRRPAVLGDLHAEAIGVFCWCNRCGHSATLGVEALVAELGPAYPVPDIGARVRCSSCGAKDVATRPAWPSPGLVARH